MKPLIVRRYRLQAASGALRRICLRGPICGVRECLNFGNECRLPDDSREWYCYEHMRDQGFCPGCGNFWAGVESFDFSRSGYCENCEGDNSDFDDDWDEDLMDWDDYPHMQVMYRDPWERALSNCYSMDWGVTCGAAGSEECEFDCRIRQDYYRSLGRN